MKRLWTILIIIRRWSRQRYRYSDKRLSVKRTTAVKSCTSRRLSIT